jgi:FkbM family methyltransferase
MNQLARSAVAAAALYLRTSPIASARWRVIARFLPVLRKHGASLGEKIVRTRYGFRFRADLGDWLGQYVYLTGTYEPPTARIISALLRPGDRFADIGANSGFFTLLAASRVGTTGKVISFEPVPSMRARLLDNVHLNGFGNVEAHDIALSDRCDTLTFYVGPEGHKGVSSLRVIENPGARLQVKTVPLDDMADEVGHLRLAKIDVEGAEQKVLKGMQRITEKHRPFLLLEITDAFLRAMGDDAVSLAEGLVAKGYLMYAITESGLCPMTPQQAAEQRQYNALFAPEPVPDHLLTADCPGGGIAVRSDRLNGQRPPEKKP